MLTRGKRLSPMLRRALARAGFVTGYKHKCRRHGCDYVEEAKDTEPRKCPKHGMRLWPVAEVRQVKFKATRATCASLLTQLGASRTAVSAVLGHADMKTTMAHCAALSPGFLRAEVERLRLGILEPWVPPRPGGSRSRIGFVCCTLAARGGDPMEKAGTPGQDPQDVPALRMARDTGFEPVALSSGG